MKALIKILLGAVVIVTIGVVSTRTDYLPGSRASAEHRLQKKAAAALANTASWAAIKMDGQKAILTGEAPARADLEEAAAAVNAAAWRGGLVFGGVTAIDASGVSLYDGPPIADPFIWIVERQENDLVFTGFVPSQAARDAVYQLAAMRFPGISISGDLDIAGGAPHEDAWLSAASFGLEALARLQHGAVEANGAQFEVSGLADDEAKVAVLRQLMAALPEGFEGTVNVAIAPPAQEGAAPAVKNDEIAQNADLEVAPEQTPPVASDEEALTPPTPSIRPDIETACRASLAAALEERQVSFDSARTDIDKPSRIYLDGVAEILTRCPGVRLEITGHSDSNGGSARNRQLSLYRADAVATYLRSVGATPEQLRTRGRGEEQPLASNATPEGRARNRRIEFAIIDPAE